MRSYVYLESMSPDGTPGAVKEILYPDAVPAVFAAPVNPYTGSDLSTLRSAVSDAETALRHAISRKAASSEISKLETALRTAQRELDLVQYELRRQRLREQVGADSPFSRNESSVATGQQFMEPVPYFTRNEDNAALDELKAKVKAAVDALEQAQAAGAPAAEIAKLQETLEALRKGLQNPYQRPRTDEPPRKERIGERPTGSKNTLAEFAASVKAAVEPPTPAAPPKPAAAVKKLSPAWQKVLDDLDAWLARRALEKLRLDAQTTATPATHSARNALVLNWDTFLRDPSLRPA